MNTKSLYIKVKTHVHTPLTITSSTLNAGKRIMVGNVSKGIYEKVFASEPSQVYRLPLLLVDGRILVKEY